MNVFAALAVLALLIVVHEAGHFLAATLQGIRVSGFSIGFGPALIKRQRRGVTYAIRALPELSPFQTTTRTAIPADGRTCCATAPLRPLVIAAGCGQLAAGVRGPVWTGCPGWIACGTDPGVLVVADNRGELLIALG